MLSWSIDRFEQADSISEIVVVVAEEYLLHTSHSVIDPYGFRKVSKIVPGGVSRAESVYNGLKALPLSTNYVAIHDAARPLVAVTDIERTVACARRERAAILVRPVTDTLKRTAGQYVISTVDRTRLFRAETPQVFQYDLILECHRQNAGLTDGASATDDAVLVEQRGFKVAVVEAQEPNMKITTGEDLRLAEVLARKVLRA